MDKEHISPELAFLKNIFIPDRWENYAKRMSILSSDNPEDWRMIDFPVEIALELTNYCNLRCVMCPSPSLRRSKGYMEETVFQKVVKEIRGEKGFLFLPQGFGEPLLHKKWFELIDFASGFEISPIVVLSNGMLLDEINAHRLLNRVDVIIVTIDGVTPKTYESIRVGGNLKTVTRNIQRFLEIRGPNGKPRLVLRIIRMQDTEGEIAAFKDFWSSRISEGDIIQVAEYNDWAGQVTYRGAKTVRIKRERHPCRMLWKNLSVFHNGQVSPCCYDAEGELIVGNVLHQSLREIWNGSHLKNIRDLHIAHQFEKIPICSRCRSWF
jgi:radical SAM protein with 4Fe4S-binding SPASM domain